MSFWLQHLLVLSLVAACSWVVARQGIRTLRGKKSRLGACCAKGCDAAAAPKPGTERIVFLPSDMLTVSRRSGGSN
jgi:hypothetical protein